MAHSRRPTRRRRETSSATLDLLRRAQNGDRDAFARLYAEHLDLITRYVAVRLRDRDAIPDAVHEAFADALTELASAPHDVTGWILRLAARASTRHGWAARRYLRAAHEIHHRAAIAPASAPRTLTVGRRMAFVAGIARLTNNQRTAIRLRYLDGYPRDLAAAVMGCSSQTIRDLERRGLRRLNAALTRSSAGATAVAR
ncbi:RNA polymerase sigma-70 factor, ECF subfamily [Micromonospora rhizosphaerae]|uniref:RNA polymerase sigma-70 factor, ECF subfamily n=1 Tax=Micromonospora rhizosphaerae TaxID=568872 RepID=A0A1C6S981_9ACTN|nr:sigma-70 family RNA polymerase sigma factor [Micromonospora rhizosphaerae]SCL25842.1 RNA polymerase sigma-70 factor, ECF subfamily [Micromonospora rhizosphaerae]